MSQNTGICFPKGVILHCKRHTGYMDKLHWLHHQMCLARVSEQQSKTIFCANLFFQTLQLKQTFILFLISNAFPLKGLGENHFNNLKKKKSMQNIFIFNITFPSQCHSLIYGLATYFL